MSKLTGVHHVRTNHITNCLLESRARRYCMVSQSEKENTRTEYQVFIPFRSNQQASAIGTRQCATKVGGV